MAYGWYHCYRLARRDVLSGTDLAIHNADSLTYLAMGEYAFSTEG